MPLYLTRQLDREGTERTIEAACPDSCAGLYVWRFAHKDIDGVYFVIVRKVTSEAEMVYRVAIRSESVYIVDKVTEAEARKEIEEWRKSLS